MASFLHFFLIFLPLNFVRSQSPSACDPPSWPLQVSTRTGTIRGSNKTVDGRQYAVFLGIPYAQPPVAQLRFADSKPLPDSQQCVDASRNYSAKCPQPDPLTGRVSGSEDCLYLNVFTPALAARLPVMVWIHGGGFVIGAGQLNVEESLRNLVSKDVVVVSINYRLGALGFWSTLTPTVGGNLGFLDQNMALKWVRENIRQFGGDPARVTIIGQSAGGASISAHTLSPLSSGLFNQSIMMSGSMYGRWALNDDRPQSALLQKFEEKVGCPQRRQSQSSGQSADQALLQCMQGVSVEKLVLTTPDSTSAWAGRVDGKFFPSDPAELAKRRPPLSTMMGTTKDEFVPLTFAIIHGDMKKLVTTSAQIVNESIPQLIGPDKFRNFELVRQAAAVQYVQLAMANVTNNTENYWFSKDNQMKSALFFFAPSYRDASQYTASGATVYLYSFNFETFIIPPLAWKGATHGTELYFLFGDGSDAFAKKPPENPFNSQITQTMATLWTNFVKSGNPTPTGSPIIWSPLSSPSATNYLSIDAPAATMKQNYRADDVNFWNVVVPQIEANGAQVYAPRLSAIVGAFLLYFCSVVG